MQEIYIVWGPPGTGKSTSLGRWLRTKADLYGAGALAACSFTRAAATRLASVVNLPERNIGTLHAFCYRALGFPELVARHVADWNSEHPMYRLSGAKRSSTDSPFDEDGAKATLGDDRLATIDILRAQRVPRERWPSTLLQFDAAWTDWKRQNDYLDFTDLLEKCLDDVECMPGNPAACTLDEAQDCSRLQLDLMLKWAAHMQQFVLAGDPAQNLYDWCGTDANALINLAKQLPPDHLHTLPRSWRLPRAIHAQAQKWLAGARMDYDAHFEPRNAEGLVRQTNHCFRNPEILLRDAQQAISEGKSVLFLAACSYMLGNLLTLLREQGIPFCNPYRQHRQDWNPLLSGGSKQVRGVDRVLAFLKADPDTWQGGPSTWTKDEFWRWASCLASKGLFKTGAKQWIAEHKGSSETFSPLEFVEWVLPEAEADLHRICFASPTDTQDALCWLVEHATQEGRKQMEYPATVARLHGGTALMEQPRLMVGTIHSVKGGEAHTTFLFPDLSAAGMAEWDEGGRRQDAVRRLFYVGMTRSSEELVLCAPATRSHIARELRR